MSEIVKIEVADALVLKPGDRVLLIVSDGFLWTPEHVAEAQERLRERFPGVEFTVATGVESIAVQPERAA